MDQIKEKRKGKKGKGERKEGKKGGREEGKEGEKEGGREIKSWLRAQVWDGPGQRPRSTAYQLCGLKEVT